MSAVTQPRCDQCTFWGLVEGRYGNCFAAEMEDSIFRALNVRQVERGHYQFTREQGWLETRDDFGCVSFQVDTRELE